MSIDGHRVRAGCMRVQRDRPEVWLVDDSTGVVLVRMGPEDAGRLAAELVSAAGLVLAQGGTLPEETGDTDVPDPTVGPGNGGAPEDREEQ